MLQAISILKSMGGRSAERFRTNIAVRRTLGEILFYEGKVVPAYFHANCGGHTEDVSELWKHDLKPLKGVPDRFCVNAPLYRWEKNYKSSNIQDELNENGYDIGLIKEIKITEKNHSGRNKNLKIIDRAGKMTLITGKKFRDIIGPNTIKSNKYDINMKGYFFDLVGQGWGMGLGCVSGEPTRCLVNDIIMTIY